MKKRKRKSRSISITSLLPSICDCDCDCPCPCSYLVRRRHSTVRIYEAQYCTTYLGGTPHSTDNLRKPKPKTNTRSYAKAGRISPPSWFSFFLILVLVTSLSLCLSLWLGGIQDRDSRVVLSLDFWLCFYLYFTFSYTFHIYMCVFLRTKAWWIYIPVTRW